MTKIYGDISPLKGHILVSDMEKGDRLSRGGIIITDDNGQNRGIRPRWAKVYKVGSDIDFIEPGEWVLMEHGRWTHGVEMITPDQTLYIQRIDVDAILLVADENPEL